MNVADKQARFYVIT